MDLELRRLLIADDASAWTDAGFTVRDGQAVIDGVTLELTGDPDRAGIVGWALSGVDADAIDGLPAHDAPAHSTDAVAAGHPNGSTSIDHVVVASPDLPRTTAAFEGLGIVARRTRDTDAYGAPMRQIFFRLGRPILEVIGPPEPSGDQPCSFWGLALTVADLDATQELLGDCLSGPKEAVQAGRRIATLRGRELGISVPIAFMTP